MHVNILLSRKSARKTNILIVIKNISLLRSHAAYKRSIRTNSCKKLVKRTSVPCESNIILLIETVKIAALALGIPRVTLCSHTAEK